MTRQTLPTRALREQPDLDQLKRQAKGLLKRFRDGHGDAVAEVRTHYHGADAASFALHDAQLVVARSYGFDSWPKLKAYVHAAISDLLRAEIKSSATVTPSADH